MSVYEGHRVKVKVKIKVKFFVQWLPSIAYTHLCFLTSVNRC